MKKGKTVLAAVALGALTYVAYLAFDIKNPEKPAPVTTPYAVVAETPVQTVAGTQAVKPRRMAARKAVKYRKAAVAKQDEAVQTADEKKSAGEVPMPAGWNGHFEKQNLRGQTNDCDIDRPCSPRGRDGVLLVGASFALNGWSPQVPQILAVGSYHQRTPLLVYK